MQDYLQVNKHLEEQLRGINNTPQYRINPNGDATLQTSWTIEEKSAQLNGVATGRIQVLTTVNRNLPYRKVWFMYLLTDYDSAYLSGRIRFWDRGNIQFEIPFYRFHHSEAALATTPEKTVSDGYYNAFVQYARRIAFPEPITDQDGIATGGQGKGIVNDCIEGAFLLPESGVVSIYRVIAVPVKITCHCDKVDLITEAYSILTSGIQSGNSVGFFAMRSGNAPF
jgi:hypothetical protein